MDEKKTIVFESDYDDEWYQHYFVCSACECQFMTYLHNMLPHNYCPNCGKKLVKEDNSNG